MYRFISSMFLLGAILTSNVHAQTISEANTVHGEASKAAIQRYRDDSVLIHELEDALYVLKMASGPRTRGRKPTGYRGVYSEADVIRMIRERVLHRV